MAIEIVDFPIKNGGSFQFAKCVSSPEGSGLLVSMTYTSCILVSRESRDFSSALLKRMFFFVSGTACPKSDWAEVRFSNLMGFFLQIQTIIQYRIGLFSGLIQCNSYISLVYNTRN